MKALVTGATGFVGGHLVDALLARGHLVTALVRSAAKAQELTRRGVSLVVGDLDDHQALAKAAAGQEVVYHLAGLIAARTETEFIDVNQDGTRRIGAAAAHAGVGRFVLVSSLAAAGPTVPGKPLDGTEPGHPVTRYGRSKLAAEAVVKALSIPWTIVRPPAVYGPGDREMYRVFRAASLGFAPVFGRGEQRLSLVFAPDLALAIAAAGESPATVGRIFHACHPEVLTTREMVGTIGLAAGRRVMVIPIPRPVGRLLLWTTDMGARIARRATVLSLDKAAEFFAPAWLGDPGPLTEATGWKAAHDLGAGARLTFAWYRANRWL